MSDESNKHEFLWKVETSKGTIPIYAEAVIKGNTLRLQEIDVQPGPHKTGLNSEMQAAKAELIRRAREQGFTRLEISAERVPGSTSAKPGKTVDFSVDLTKGEPKQVKAYQLSADPAVRYGQEVNRLQALQKTYQTRRSHDIARSKPKDKGKEYE